MLAGKTACNPFCQIWQLLVPKRQHGDSWRTNSHTLKKGLNKANRWQKPTFYTVYFYHKATTRNNIKVGRHLLVSEVLRCVSTATAIWPPSVKVQVKHTSALASFVQTASNKHALYALWSMAMLQLVWTLDKCSQGLPSVYSNKSAAGVMTTLC